MMNKQKKIVISLMLVVVTLLGVLGITSFAADAAVVSVYAQVDYETDKVVDLKYFDYVGTASDLEGAAKLLNGANGGLIEISEGTLTVTNRQDITLDNVIIKGAGKDKTTVVGNATNFNNSTNGLKSSSLSSEYKAVLGLHGNNIKIADITISGGDCGYTKYSVDVKDFKTVRVNSGVSYFENVSITGLKGRSNLMVGTSDTASIIYAYGLEVQDPSSFLYGATEITSGSTLNSYNSYLGGSVVGSTDNLGSGYYKLVYGGITAYTTIPNAIESYNSGAFASLMTAAFVDANGEQGKTVAEAMTADLTTVLNGTTTLLYGNDCDEMLALAVEFRAALATLSAETGVDVSASLATLDSAIALDSWHGNVVDTTCEVCGKTGIVHSVAKVFDKNGALVGSTATVLEAIQLALDTGAAEILVLESVSEKMPTDVEIVLNSDLTITADEDVVLSFYNEGTSYDFVVNSNTELGNFTLTIGENVTFELKDRVIWFGYYGNNVETVINGHVSGYQIWHGADTTVTSTGSLVSSGEAFVMRRGATLTVDGGYVNANYFNILAGSIEATDATVDCGPLWISNTDAYTGEGSVYLYFKNSTVNSTGNIESVGGNVLIEMVDSTLTTALHDGVASSIDANTIVWLDNSSFTLVTASFAGQLDLANNSTLTVTGTLTNSGTIDVYDEATLNIATLEDESINLCDGAILKDSTIGGSVFVAGGVTFRGKNTVNMVYDYGTLTDYYGTSANMAWTVEKGSSLTIVDKARYGLGYGDNVTIYGSVEDALSARGTLTDDDLALFMHGLVAQESKGWNCVSVMNVYDAYVLIGSNNSFGNKPGNYGGSYTFNFENVVLDASRITFYEALSTTTFTFENSDVKVGTFMTNDTDSVFNIINSVILSTTTTNGNDEGNYNAGKLNLINAILTYNAALRNNGEIYIDFASVLTAPSITGTGKIVIDVTAFAGDSVQVINADMTGFNGTIELVGNKAVSYRITDSGVIIENNSVAKIGDVFYSDLQAAINAVQDGETITLLNNVTVATPAYGANALNFAKAVDCTIDLNGYTISANTGNSVLRFNISGSGATADVTLTLKNGKIVAGSNTWCTVMASGISADVKAIMNLENLTIESSKAGDLAVKAWDNSVINANNVTVNATNGAGGFYALGGEIVLDDCIVNQSGLHTAPYLSVALAVSNGGKITVNSGNYSSAPTAAAEGNNQGTSHGSWVAAIMNSGGTLIINGGTFTNDNFGDNSLATAARGLILVDTAGKLEIYGGNFNALKRVIDIQNNLGVLPNPAVVISGGVFSSDPRVSASYGSECIAVAKGYTVASAKNSDSYAVVKNVVTFLGGSLRYIDGTATSANMRFGYKFDSSFNFDGAVWGWYVTFAGNTVKLTGTNYTTKNITNLVLTGIPVEMFKESISARIYYEVTVDGETYVVEGTDASRSVFGVATAIVNDPTESAESVKYAQSIIAAVENREAALLPKEDENNAE